MIRVMPTVDLLTHGRARAALLAVSLCVSAAGPLALAPVVDAHVPSASALKSDAEKATIKAVKTRLPNGHRHGLTPPRTPVKVKVTSCKQRAAHGVLAAFKCSWNAHGELAGRVPLRCNGRATYEVKPAGITGGARCKNITEIQAPLHEARHDVAFGYFEDFSRIDGLYNRAADGGAQLVREGITWTVLQPTEGRSVENWNWSDFDAVYKNALAAGMRPVFTFRNAPCWAAPAPCKPNAPNPVARAHIDDYAYAAAQIAMRYPELAGIEIWFEPNSKIYWGAKPDPAAFSSLVRAAADAVHASGTGAQVYTGGLAPGMASPNKLEYGKFLSKALDAGGVRRADAIAFHAVAEVPFRSPNDPTRGYLGRLRIQIQSLQRALATHHVSRPIVLTQLSYSTGPGEYTEQQQAAALVSSYELVGRLGGVDAAIVSRLLDNGDGSKVAGFGVLHPDRSPKAAYCQLAAAREVPKPAGC